MRAIKSVRLKDFDYSSDGFYFITICTSYRRPYLVGKNRELLNGLVEQLPSKVDGMRLDYYQIMPSHIHLILTLEGCQLKLADIIRRLKAAATKQIGLKLWQPNYYEHVVRNEEALTRIREYIQNNPMAEMIELERVYEM